MKALRTENIVPIGEFKAHAAKMLLIVRDGDEPVVITQNGRATAVLISPAEYDRLTYREFVRRKIETGLAESEAGLGTDDADLDDWFASLTGETTP